MLRQMVENSARPLTDREKASHLLHRAGLGPRPGDVDRVIDMGREAYIEEQLHPERIDDTEVDRWDSVFETRGADPAVLRTKNRPRSILNQLMVYKVMRGIHSRRQLHEALVDFWFNHFNIDWTKNEAQFLTTSYDRDVIRPLALGKFGSLLLATARHPAMLVYLDNASSSSPDINENYARELMELHTLGVDGGYTQRDVEEVARCFSGWTIDREALTFRYVESMHAPGAKAVLGQRIPESGREEGEAVLKLLAAHPSTARFIASKIVHRFVSEDPPSPLVSRVAGVFEQTGGDIREMLRTILMSDDFYDARVHRATVKSPFELVVSAIRAVDAEVRIPRTLVSTNENRTELRITNSSMISSTGGRFDPASFGLLLRQTEGLDPELQAYTYLIEHMQNMGQFLYQYEAPAGYPERGSFWINDVTTLNRISFAVSLAQNQVEGILIKDIKDMKDDRLQQLPGPAELALTLGSPEFQRK